MHHANAMGMGQVLNKLNKYYEITKSDTFKPASLIKKLAEIDGKFGDAPAKEDRKEKLSFSESSVAGNL
jgi:hypothetical protein